MEEESRQAYPPRLAASMDSRIVALYYVRDDLLRYLGSRKDLHRRMRIAEVLCTALVLAWLFGGNCEHGLLQFASQLPDLSTLRGQSPTTRECVGSSGGLNLTLPAAAQTSADIQLPRRLREGLLFLDHPRWIRAQGLHLHWRALPPCCPAQRAASICAPPRDSPPAPVSTPRA